jgi:hypothetical protein
MKISLVFTTSQSAFRIQTLNFIFFIAVKILKMNEFTNFENSDLLNYIFSDENDIPVLPAEDTEPDTTSGYI